MIQQQEAQAAKQGELEESEKTAAELRTSAASLTAEKERAEEQAAAAKQQLAEAQELLRSNQQVIQWLNKELNEAQTGGRPYVNVPSRVTSFKPGFPSSFKLGSGVAGGMPGGVSSPSATGTSLQSPEASAAAALASSRAGGQTPMLRSQARRSRRSNRARGWPWPRARRVIRPTRPAALPTTSHPPHPPREERGGGQSPEEAPHAFLTGRLWCGARVCPPTASIVSCVRRRDTRGHVAGVVETKSKFRDWRVEGRNSGLSRRRTRAPCCAHDVEALCLARSSTRRETHVERTSDEHID